jgi:O-antigen/teichoic acid export membrane protein
MRVHFSNAAYGVLDYAAYPIGMLLAAPMLLKHLGVTQYGVWVIATAAVNAGSIVASGFGDANIQYVASARSHGHTGPLLNAVRSMLGINLVLGCALALVSWMLAPVAARHVVPSDASLQIACLWSLRIASLLMPVRALESVCISTQRAFERYGAAVRISIVARLLALASAVPLASFGAGVGPIMAVAGALILLGTVIQLIRLRQHLGATSFSPRFDRRATTALWSFGAFSWMQAVAGVIFSQADRLILGVSLGAAAVTGYTLCVQMAQPIYGVAAAGLHFLFPYLSRRQATDSPAALKKTIFTAFVVNLLLVSAGTAAALLFGRSLLHAWVGDAVAKSAGTLLTPIIWSFALLGINVTAYYALLAFGRVRTVTWLTISGGTAMLLMVVLLLPRTGIAGVATARLVYGVVTLLMYVPLLRLLSNAADDFLPVSGISPVCEEA